MGLFTSFQTRLQKATSYSLPPVQTSYIAKNIAALDRHISQGGPSAVYAQMVKNAMTKSTGNATHVVRSSAPRITGINDYGFKGRRQYIADRRYLYDLYALAYNVADIRTAIVNLRNEVFRRGLEWIPAFDFKCEKCNREFTRREAKKHKLRCPDCIAEDKFGRPVGEDGQPLEIKRDHDGMEVASGEPAHPKLHAPDPAQRQHVSEMIEDRNYYGQSLDQVLRECEDDINICDDGFIYMIKEYYRDEGDKLTDPSKETLRHIVRLDPILLEFDLDQRGVPGMRHHVCLFHRDNLLEVPPEMVEEWAEDWGGTCAVPDCEEKTYPIFFKYNEQYLSGGYGTAQTKVLYLTKDEVIHWSRHAGSELYGVPPLFAIYEKALTLVGMDRYLYDYFFERRVPQGAIAVTTDDTESIRSQFAETEAKMADDPHYIPWIGVSSKTGHGRMEFIRFAYSLDELNYLPVRDEIRERIGALYGVSPLWMADVSNAGGLNNEGQQLKVQSRVVENAQSSYKTDVFPKLLKSWGVTDWKLQLQTPEEVNEMAEIEIKQMKATLAQSMVAMGFGANYDQELDEWEFFGRVPSQEEMQDQAMQAMQGGLGGGAYGGSPTGAPPNQGGGASGGDQAPPMPQGAPGGAAGGMPSPAGMAMLQQQGGQPMQMAYDGPSNPLINALFKAATDLAAHDIRKRRLSESVRRAKASRRN